MKPRAITIYVGFIVALAIVALWATDWAQLRAVASQDFWGLATLVLLYLVAEQQALSFKAAGLSGQTSIGFLPLFTVVLLFGPAAAVGTMLLGGIVLEYFVRHKELIRANFNVSQWIIAAALGGAAFMASGGTPLLLIQPSERSGALLIQFGPFILFGVVFLWVNNAAVALAIAINQELPYRDVWSRMAGRAGANILYDLLVGPLAIAVAALYLQVGTVGLLLSILPLFFIRHSYQLAHQLQFANRDLLKALVKAIETRDPYTSGHSLRVSQLARRIADGMGLPTRTAEYIEMAALLHDIGKIEAVYTDILRKPSSLTPDERAIIESHVTKGEEVLRNLSTVPEEVIRSVRHHHEREDGGGYPDRLKGEAIPLGAKIIVVCDSVDAMLSDRPYRKALSVVMVHQQLKEHVGRQFDAKVVRVLLERGLLSDYASMMGAARADMSRAAIPVTLSPARASRRAFHIPPPIPH